jgi:hypothetical protein
MARVLSQIEEEWLSRYGLNTGAEDAVRKAWVSGDFNESSYKVGYFCDHGLIYLLCALLAFHVIFRDPVSMFFAYAAAVVSVILCVLYIASCFISTILDDNSDWQFGPLSFDSMYSVCYYAKNNFTKYGPLALAFLLLLSGFYRPAAIAVITFVGIYSANSIRGRRTKAALEEANEAFIKNIISKNALDDKQRTNY